MTILVERDTRSMLGQNVLASNDLVVILIVQPPELMVSLPLTRNAATGQIWRTEQTVYVFDCIYSSSTGILGELENCNVNAPPQE